MATKRISQLPVITAVTDDDFIIINDGNTVTSRINYGQFKLSLPDADVALGGLNDVSVPSPANGEVLTWNAAGSEWVAAALPDAATITLEELTDVDLTTSAPVSGEVLGYNGTNWEPVAVATPLANIADSAQGVNVTGKVACEDIDLDVGGTLTAAGCTVDFSSATVIFSGASVGGLQGEISDGVDFHLNQSTATDGQVLSWNATGGAQSTGDYEWITPATGGGGSASASSFTWDASLIPDTNAQYDLGNAEYKVRHLFLSDNSIKFDSGDLGVTEARLTYADVPLANALLYQVTSAGNDSYVLDGPGIVGKANPRLHLTRGETYYFNNTMGMHPMEIRVAPGGAEYVDGVVDARRTDGVMSFTVPMDAPDTLVYQCTLHPSMVGEIYVMNDATTRIVDTNVPASNTDTGTPGEIRYGNSFLYICVATNSWKRVALADF